MSYSLKWEDNAVYVTYNENLTPMDVMRGNNEIYSDPRFDTLQFQICDFLKAKTLAATEHDARMIGAMDKSSTRWNNNVKVICIVKNQQLIELIDVYAKMLEDTQWKVIIVSSMQDALKIMKQA